MSLVEKLEKLEKKVPEFHIHYYAKGFFCIEDKKTRYEVELEPYVSAFGRTLYSAICKALKKA